MDHRTTSHSNNVNGCYNATTTMTVALSEHSPMLPPPPSSDAAVNPFGSTTNTITMEPTVAYYSSNGNDQNKNNNSAFGGGASNGATLPSSPSPTDLLSASPQQEAPRVAEASRQKPPEPQNAPLVAGLGKIGATRGGATSSTSGHNNTLSWRQSPPEQRLQQQQPPPPPSQPNPKRIVIVPQRAVNGGLDFKFDYSDPSNSTAALSTLPLQRLSPQEYEACIRQLNETIKPARSNLLDVSLLVTGPALVPLAVWALRRSHQTKRRKELLQRAIDDFNQQYSDSHGLYMKWNKRQGAATEGYLSIEEIGSTNNNNTTTTASSFSLRSPHYHSHPSSSSSSSSFPPRLQQPHSYQHQHPQPPYSQFSSDRQQQQQQQQQQHEPPTSGAPNNFIQPQFNSSRQQGPSTAPGAPLNNCSPTNSGDGGSSNAGMSSRTGVV